MICPLMSKAFIDTGNENAEDVNLIDCRENLCAWWYASENCCSITLIAGNSFEGGR